MTATSTPQRPEVYKGIGRVVEQLAEAMPAKGATFLIEFAKQTLHNRDGRTAEMIQGRTLPCVGSLKFTESGDVLLPGDEVTALVSPDDPKRPGTIIYKRRPVYARGR